MACNKDSECCCNCTNHVKIMCHPANGNNVEYGFLDDNIKIGKGPNNQQLAWGCMASIGLNGDNAITYFDFEHGMCELFEPKEENKYE